jgi:hypothetical protein
MKSHIYIMHERLIRTGEQAHQGKHQPELYEIQLVWVLPILVMND